MNRTSAPVPVVAVGNLTVGGSGKTPISNWIARYYAAQGLQPAIVLRGYGGGDEGLVHRRLSEDAIVIEDPDRAAAADKAAAHGADVVVLDDGFQRLDLHRDLDLVLVSAESGRAVSWTLPAGPWREGLRAVRRADLLVITRKRADMTAALTMAKRLERYAPHTPIAIARLGIAGFRHLLTDELVPTQAIDGVRVLAAAGVADPESFAKQCGAFGASVKMFPLANHHGFTDHDVNELLRAGKRVDYVVVTEKDAVKLRSVWPSGAPEPLVASLDVTWERGQDEIETALDAVVMDVHDLLADQVAP